MQNLADKFRKAGLSVAILAEPIRRRGRGMEDIVQIDIQRNVKGFNRRERFRLYPGHKSNIIQVRNIDPNLKQLVLFVKEPVREFDNVTQLNSFTTFKRIKEEAEKSLHKPVRIFRVGNEAHVVMKTSEGVRYFLLGVDERQLFIAQLTGPATTVEGARKLLGKTVQFANGKRRGSSIDRQGEWFFLETKQSTRDEIERAIRQTRIVVRRKVAIGQFLNRPGLNPHIVDELVVLHSGIQETGADPKKLLRNRVFVRGSIRHRDHKTVKFSNWREVIANNESESTARGSATGVFWVD
jgi:hypothetical protein